MILNQEEVKIASKYDYHENLLDVYVDLKLDKKKLTELKGKLSLKIIKTVYYVFLSEDKNKEMLIYSFVKSTLKYGDEVFYRRNIPTINETLSLAQSVSREAHKLKGFLRFQKTDNNFYYAEMESKYNIISILIRHFKNRLNEAFVIKDNKRKIYGIYDLNKVIYLKEKDIINFNLDLTKENTYYEDLWKTFFNTIAIKERKNLKTQMNFMPKKYWKYIIEMSDKNENNS